MLQSPECKTFQKIYQIVRRVPAGHVVTYGQIASALGTRQLARTVGWAMRACPDDVPWHRVINSQGAISTPRITGTANLQKALLEAEGVEFRVDGTIDLHLYGCSALAVEDL